MVSHRLYFQEFHSGASESPQWSFQKHLITFEGFGRCTLQDLFCRSKCQRAWPRGYRLSLINCIWTVPFLLIIRLLSFSSPLPVYRSSDISSTVFHLLSKYLFKNLFHRLIDPLHAHAFSFRDLFDTHPLHSHKQPAPLRLRQKPHFFK